MRRDIRRNHVASVPIVVIRNARHKRTTDLDQRGDSRGYMNEVGASATCAQEGRILTKGRGIACAYSCLVRRYGLVRICAIVEEQVRRTRRTGVEVVVVGS